MMQSGPGRNNRLKGIFWRARDIYFCGDEDECEAWCLGPSCHLIIKETSIIEWNGRTRELFLDKLKSLLRKPNKKHTLKHTVWMASWIYKNRENIKEDVKKLGFRVRELHGIICAR